MNTSEYYAMNHHELSHWWFKTLHTMTLKKIKEISSTQHVTHVFDAGCGTGGFIYLLEKSLPDLHVTGLDTSSLALDLARQKLQCRLVKGSINSIPLEPNIFNIVVSHDVLCHKFVNMEKTLHEFKRILKKGGYLILNLPAFQSLYSHHDQNVHTLHRFTKKDIYKLFKKETWNIEQLFYWNSLLLPFMIPFRYLKKNQSKKKEASSDVEVTNQFLNKILYRILSFERLAFKHVSWIPGLSLYVVLKRK